MKIYEQFNRHIIKRDLGWMLKIQRYREKKKKSHMHQEETAL